MPFSILGEGEHRSHLAAGLGRHRVVGHTLVVAVGLDMRLAVGPDMRLAVGHTVGVGRYDIVSFLPYDEDGLPLTTGQVEPDRTVLVVGLRIDLTIVRLFLL